MSWLHLRLGLLNNLRDLLGMRLGFDSVSSVLVILLVFLESIVIPVFGLLLSLLEQLHEFIFLLKPVEASMFLGVLTRIKVGLPQRWFVRLQLFWGGPWNICELIEVIHWLQVLCSLVVEQLNFKQLLLYLVAVASISHWFLSNINIKLCEIKSRSELICLLINWNDQSNL